MNFILFYFLSLFLSIHRSQQPRSRWPRTAEVRSQVKLQQFFGIEISPTPPLIFTVGQKCEIWRRSNITQLWAAHVWKYSKISELWNKNAMLWWSPYTRHPWESSVSWASPPKIVRQTKQCFGKQFSYTGQSDRPVKMLQVFGLLVTRPADHDNHRALYVHHHRGISSAPITL